VNRRTPQLEMPIPEELIDAIAEHVANIIFDHLGSAPGILDRLADQFRGFGLVRGCLPPK
jgi:hypothetical protein